MPTFAELKAKAAGAANSGKEKITNVRDRNTSVPMAKTNWDPYSGDSAPPPPPPRSLLNNKTKPKPLAPLPPPPSRTSSSALSTASSNRSTPSPAPPALPKRSSPAPAPAPAPPPRKSASSAILPPPSVRSSEAPSSAGNGPPPIVRSTRPDSHTRRATSTAPDKIDWANLTPEDKEVFFSWLDEFFANFTPPTRAKTDDTLAGPLGHSNLPSHGPPPLRPSSKPSTWAQHSIGNQSTSFVLSHPPATTYGSGAFDLVRYFAPTTSWADAWYNPTDGPSIPPPLAGDRNHSYRSSWRLRGSNKTIHIGICFADLSLFWGTVEFSTAGGPPSAAKRSASYLPPPKALPRQELVDAHETYGDTIALFAESFLGSGQYCGRGECWDLAHEGLKYFANYDYIPKPVPSTSRTHGHLIYEGMANNNGETMVGRWRGGDDRIRRGDIAEWRRVKIGVKDAPAGSNFTLGDPDHTSIIVSDCVLKTMPVDGGSLLPAELGVLIVVEQSIGQPPKRNEYDLSYLKEGEMWIYRPVSMEVYLGVNDLTAEPPDGLRVQRL